MSTLLPAYNQGLDSPFSDPDGPLTLSTKMVRAGHTVAVGRVQVLRLCRGAFTGSDISVTVVPGGVLCWVVASK